MIAAIYARKSTDQTSVADEHVYVDDGISGAEFANRPGFLRLMNALKPRRPVPDAHHVRRIAAWTRGDRDRLRPKQLVTAGVRVFFYLEDRERYVHVPPIRARCVRRGISPRLHRPLSASKCCVRQSTRFTGQ